MQEKIFDCVGCASVCTLNRYVVESLIQRNVAAVAIPLFPSVTTSRKQKIDATGNLNLVFDLAAKGLVPVVHGDVVLDLVQRCTIFGGDRILEWLCENVDQATQPPEKAGKLPLE